MAIISLLVCFRIKSRRDQAKEEAYMRVELFRVIGEYQVVIGFNKPTPNPQATDEAVKEKYPEWKKLPYDDLFQAYTENTVYSEPGPGSLLLSDEVAVLQEFKFKNLTKAEKLLVSGEIIPDYTNAKYWQKTDDTWIESLIASLGEALPLGGVFEVDLSPIQQAEIDAQKERGRIAAITPTEREAEIEGLLKSLASETLRLQELAELQEEAFNKTAYYQSRKAEIELRYTQP
jgi:hypothetical protein